ncbi:hypothetical protein V8E55_011960 [Tylopilus felleus]
MEGLTGRQAQNEGSSQCKWTDRDVGLLMHYLKEHSTERGEGGFKKHTLNSAAEYVNAHGDRQGKLKDLESVRGKFKSLKEYYTVIKAWTRKSGVHYDNINRANIRDDESAKVFDAFASEKGHTKMKAFRNKGWEYFSAMEEIFPEEVSTGSASWRGSSGTLGTQPPPPGTSTSMPSSSASAASQVVYPPTVATQPPGSTHSSSLPHHISPLTTSTPSITANPRVAGKKRLYSSIFPPAEESSATSPTSSPLFSVPPPPATMSSSIPPSRASKRSRKSAAAEA